MTVKFPKGVKIGSTDITAASGVSALTAGTSPAPNAVLVPGVESGNARQYVVGDIRRFIPFEYTLFHGGVTGVYTLTPLTAGTVEPANAPMARGLADLALATQMRLVVGLRIVAAGGTTCTARVQYSTNGVTQTAWADAQNTGTGVNLMTGTANVIREAGWVDLVSGAKIADCFFRLAFVLTGTTTTAPTLSWARVLFR